SAPHLSVFLYLLPHPPPTSPLFPYTTLFRSSPGPAGRAACPPACRGSPRPRARTGSPRPPRSRDRAGRSRTRRRARSLSRLQIVRGGDRDGARLGVGVQRRPHEAVDDGARMGDAQLLEQKGERLLQVGRHGLAHGGGKIPQPPLERPDRLLAGLVSELLLGVALL